MSVVTLLLTPTLFFTLSLSVPYPNEYVLQYSDLNSSVFFSHILCSHVSSISSPCKFAFLD